jgi:hypothetical protein
MTFFTVRFDTRSKVVILEALQKELKIAFENINGGDYSEDAFVRYEELNRLVRGILFTKPDVEENK